ncbi:hypothetical protein ABT324_02635 [Saccharopolyspora sp. NPDC000359]|uniref:hypothetical protein n=1 Tax=Saccharopolyspora sp. NPDC000359 TaxID=3154251 RepID=UPI00331F6430
MPPMPSPPNGPGTAPSTPVPGLERSALRVRWRGSAGLFELLGEPPDSAEHRLLASLPDVPGTVVLLATMAAGTASDLPNAVWQTCGRVFGPPNQAGFRGLWLLVRGAGVPDLSGRVYAQTLADTFGVEVVASVGEVVVAGPLAFATGPGGVPGWARFRRGSTSTPCGYRLAPPGWEVLLPPRPLVEQDAAFEHVPAGLLVRPVRSRSSGPGDPARAIPVIPGTPSVVLGRPGDQELALQSVVTALRRMPAALLDSCRFVPAAAGTSSAAWLQRFADRLGRDVVASTGVPEPDGVVTVHDARGETTWCPVPTLLRYSPGAPTTVLASSPPPPGWLPAEPGCSRPATGAPLRLHVVPSGLALTTVDESVDVLPRSPFEAHRMTLTVTPAAVAAEAQLVGELLPVLAKRCGNRLRVLLVGPAKDGTAAALREAVRKCGAEFEVREAPVEKATVVVPRPGADEPEPGEGDDVPTAVVAPLLPRPATLSSGPSGAPDGADVGARTVRIPAPVKAAPVPVEHRDPLFPPDHVSTPEERATFLDWAGEDFDTEVGAVNAALALFPSLRGDDEDAARVDLVAVRLYLGGGDRGGAALNERLRTGKEPCAAYLACLMSGLRRLPAQRGAVFRGVSWPWDQDVQDCYQVGAVLSEPGLVSAVPCDGGVPEGPCVDVGIWSRSARRTSVLTPVGQENEVVFGQRGRFRVLAVERGDGGSALLLDELPAGARTGSGELEDGDLAVTDRLRAALRRRRDRELATVDGAQAARFNQAVGLVAEVADVAAKQVSVTAP